MESAANKSERLVQLEMILIAHQNGLRRSEIARKMGINRSTVGRYVDELSARHNSPVPLYEEDGLIKINRDKYLNNLSLTIHEAMSLHLATRLMATRMDKHNPYAASAMRKLSQALEAFAPAISNHLRLSADVMDDAGQRYDPNYLRTLEVLTRCWSEGRLVHIWHKSERTGKVIEYIFAPYFIEPYAVGQTTHVIGLGRSLEPMSSDRMWTFKIERIERVEPLDETYSIPTDFNPQEQLANAWGIWYTGDEPVEVVLKFHPRVAGRVKETRWHRSEDSEELPDGYLQWQAKIAQPKEMLNWIRGWGADVEVVGPVWLRKKLEREARRLAELYGVAKKTDDDLIAHWRQRDETPQALLTHLQEASELAEGFAAKVGLPEIGKILGLLHDFGKASKEYQNYLRSAEGLINPDEDADYVDYKAMKGKVDHSTAGAQLVYHKLAGRGREGQLMGQFLALALASHHSGLIDCLKPSGENEFNRRITKDDKNTHLAEARSKLPSIEKQLDEILVQPIEKRFFAKVFQEMKESDDSKETLWFKRGLLARFLLSCLLDADRLNTADFEWPKNEVIRNYGKYIPWETLIKRLETKFTTFAQETAQMKPGPALEVNQLRAQVAQACLDAASKKKGIYRLAVPTGGGKTLASLRFALHHAQTHKMDRVFYIVPYITIIDQNAKDVREVLNDIDGNDKPLGKIVLEHHSNFVPPDDTRLRHNLLAQNWDAPIIFTTQVQFLEALFSAGTRDARRMHQLANSIIIFDEVQTIPIKITHMFTTALCFLTHDCGATVMLCTATQPPFNNLENPYRKLDIKLEQHIIQNEPELFEKLKRVEVHDERKPGGMTNAEITDLAERALQEKGSVLIVVNTRAMAQSLYQEIKKRNLADTFHLSTNMCPAHRVDKFEAIKAKLEAKKPVICVSTQLIEAGVDIDFGAVIRSLAGLDSITQAAGRCNRHGEREGLGSVWVVNPQDENLSPLPDIREGREIGGSVLRAYQRNPNRFGNDRIGIKAVAKYYHDYFQRKTSEFEYLVGVKDGLEEDNSLFEMLARNRRAGGDYTNTLELRQSFKKASRLFQVIDKLTTGVIVPYENGKEIITDLCGDVDSRQMRELLKQAQQYSINLYRDQFKNLKEAGAIYEIKMNEKPVTYYLDLQHYSNEFGWSFDVVGKQEFICF